MKNSNEHVTCPCCGEKMNIVSERGYSWIQCNCGLRTPFMWHTPLNKVKEKYLKYLCDNKLILTR